MAFSGGGQCWPSLPEAALAQCTAINGVMSSSIVSCDNVVALNYSLSRATLKYRFVSNTGLVTTRDSYWFSSTCEYPTFNDFWLPVLLTALVAVVTIRATLSIRDIFKRETY